MVNSVGSNTIQSSGTNANVYLGPSGSAVIDPLIYTEPGSTLLQASSAPFVSSMSMQKLHAGTLILAANNSGLTGSASNYVVQGTLTLRNNGALGASTNKLYVAVGAALDIDGANTTSGGSGISLANNLYLAGGGLSDPYGRFTGALDALGGTNTLSGTITCPAADGWQTRTGVIPRSAWPAATRPLAAC